MEQWPCFRCSTYGLLALCVVIISCGRDRLGSLLHPNQGLALLPSPQVAPLVSPPGWMQQLAIPPRLQWMGNYGYCGEVALLSAGLYFGQYASQYDVRALASPGEPQNAVASQLLLGINDAAAAHAMRLRTLTYPHPSHPQPKEFLLWIKQQLLKGFPVTIGLFMNQARFYGSTGLAGDELYDHIVPVTGLRSAAAKSDTSFHGDDELMFSDNGLWSPGERPPFAFNMRFDALLRSRRAANQVSAPVYAVTSEKETFALAVLGVMDEDATTLPVRLMVDTDYEPPIADGGTARPPAMPLQVSAVVHGLAPNKSYRLYRYDAFNKVPTTHFNAAAAQAVEVMAIGPEHGPSFTVHRKVMSDATVIFRAVPSSAP